MNWFALPVVACTAYWLLALFAALKRLREPLRRSTYHPPLSILKPIRGRDEHFYDAILSHAKQHYPEFEIVFGIRDPDDAAWGDIRRLIAEFPAIPIRTITDAPETPTAKWAC